MSERKGQKLVDPKKSFVVHPDVHDFYKNYKPGKKFEVEVGKKRNELKEQGLPYHNTDHDAEMEETARDNTDNAVTSGWKFPWTKK